MKTFYLSGHRTFGNRGCEAIVRSTVGLLKEQFGEITVLVPSDNIERDKKQWLDSQEHGVTFVPLYYPYLTRLWVQIQRLPFSFVKQMRWPFPATKSLKEQLQSVDAVLSIGGDMYTYEGRLPSWIMGLDQIAMQLGKPVILWGATVGSFDKEPIFVPKLKEHFRRMNLIVVRESMSESYLTKKLGLSNVVRMSDSAFTLPSEEINTEEFWPDDLGGGVLGLNVSPLIEKFSGQGNSISTEIIKFIRLVINEKKLSVLLVPHVTPLDESGKNDDATYMREVLNSLKDLGGRVHMMDKGLNAVQTKYVISKCRFFIGARTHATIAGLSSAVPTVSIAYSLKAKGINSDLFGNRPLVVDLKKVSANVLFESLLYLESHEEELKTLLEDKKVDTKKDILKVLQTLETTVFSRN